MKGFDYILIYYYKWISSCGKTISEYSVEWGGWSKTPNFGCFYIWPIECVEEKDFSQLIAILPNDTENPHCYNYADKGQSWISLEYCHLNPLLAIIIFKHEKRLGVCIKMEFHKS